MKRLTIPAFLVLLSACGGGLPSPLGREPPCQSQEIAISDHLTFLMGGDPECLPQDETKIACGNSVTDSSGVSSEDRTIPEHMVRLDPYFLDQTEVTNLQYRECVDQGVCGPPGDCIPLMPFVSLYYGCRYERPDYDDLPVVAVTWDNARTYCEWRGKRLPTEAEWERAAVGPRPAGAVARTFAWGDPNGLEPPASSQAVFAPESQCSSKLEAEPKEVHTDARADGQSAEGVYDLTGNVREWTADDYDPSFYCSSPTSLDLRPDRPNDCHGLNHKECTRQPNIMGSAVVDNPQANNGRSLKVVRGGAFCTTTEGRVGHFCDLTTRSRFGLDKNLVSTDTPSEAPFVAGLINEAQVTGFRCARSASEPEPPQDKLCDVLPLLGDRYHQPGASSSSGVGSSSSHAGSSSSASGAGSSSSAAAASSSSGAASSSSAGPASSSSGAASSSSAGAASSSSGA